MGIIAGLIAGVIARRSYKLIWRRVERDEPPRPEQRLATLPKLALALALEGAVFRVAKGLVDHVARRGFAGVTGRWPGDDGRQAS